MNINVILGQFTASITEKLKEMNENIYSMRLKVSKEMISLKTAMDNWQEKKAVLEK